MHMCSALLSLMPCNFALHAPALYILVLSEKWLKRQESGAECNDYWQYIPIEVPISIIEIKQI